MTSIAIRTVMKTNFMTWLPLIKPLACEAKEGDLFENPRIFSSLPSIIRKVNSPFTHSRLISGIKQWCYSPLQASSLLYGTQHRAYTTQIQPPLTEGEFFNREREIRAFTSMLRVKPQLSIISGPVNSGKTSLILNILEKESKKNNRPVLHINLRERSFDTVNSFASSLERDMRSWLGRFTEVANKLNLNVKGYGFNIHTSFKEKTPDSTPIDRLNDLFEEMSKQIPPHSWWSGNQSPVLFIDEANKMHTLLKDKQGHAALTNMFEWFVMNTKETHRFHVILGSSDSFFHLWVAKYIGASRFTSYVVGDLQKNEAERFWNERIVTQTSSEIEDLSSPKFTDAYTVCGGNMFLLEKYYSQYIQRNGQMLPEDFFLIRAESSKLINALFRNGNGSISSHTENGHPVWTRDQFITMMKKLVDSKNGFLIYRDLCKEMTQEVVDAFIDYNLLHLRPSADFAYDLPEFPAGESVLTAETPSSLVAMRRILSDIEKKRI